MPPVKDREASFGFRAGMVGAAVAIQGVHMIYITASKVELEDGSLGFAYSVPISMCLVEFIKLCISLSMILRQYGSLAPLMNLSFSTFVRFSAPSLAYATSNQLLFALLIYVPPPVATLLNNIKIISTAVLFRICLQRPISRPQWVALVLLFTGIVLAQLKPDMEFSLPLAAVVIAVLQSLGSGAAGIATEFLLKSSDDPIHVQNVQLYSWGMIMNCASLYFVDLPAGGPFSNFNFWAWAAAFNSSINGLVVSAVVAYTNSIVKLYASIVAMFLSGFITWAFLNESFSFTANYFAGLCVCGFSIVLYSRNPKKATDLLPRGIVEKIRSSPFYWVLYAISSEDYTAIGDKSEDERV